MRDDATKFYESNYSGTRNKGRIVIRGIYRIYHTMRPKSSCTLKIYVDKQTEVCVGSAFAQQKWETRVDERTKQAIGNEQRQCQQCGNEQRIGIDEPIMQEALVENLINIEKQIVGGHDEQGIFAKEEQRFRDGKQAKQQGQERDAGKCGGVEEGIVGEFHIVDADIGIGDDAKEAIGGEGSGQQKRRQLLAPCAAVDDIGRSCGLACIEKGKHRRSDMQTERKMEAAQADQIAERGAERNDCETNVFIFRDNEIDDVDFKQHDQEPERRILTRLSTPK